MVAHRKNIPPPQAPVPSSWFIALTVLVVMGGAGWLGWFLLDDDDPGPVDTTALPAATATAPSSPAPSSPAPSSPAPQTEDVQPEPAGEPEPTDEPVALRTATVSVLNNSGIVGAARAFSAKVSGAGWTLGGIGNWTGSIPGNTVYYPSGQQVQAELLARDVGIDRVRPSVSPMRTDRLTIILSGTP